MYTFVGVSNYPNVFVIMKLSRAEARGLFQLAVFIAL